MEVEAARSAAAASVAASRRFHLATLPKALVLGAVADFHASRGDTAEPALAEALALAPDDTHLRGEVWGGRAQRALAEADDIPGWPTTCPWWHTGRSGGRRRCAGSRAARGWRCLDEAGDAPVPAALQALGVTSRETDVLLVVAEGRGNREIAERLHLSPRTVEKHVERLLAKTGLGSRGELVAFAARNLTPRASDPS